MKLQAAIDRVTLKQAEWLIQEIKDEADIIEIGTSLIKEYGSYAMKSLKERYPDVCFLADIKTMDEGAYEFRAYYEAGADILTVMGASAHSTIEQCRQTALAYGKEYCIDLLEVSEEKLNDLANFHDAVFCIHMPKDEQEDLKKRYEQQKIRFQNRMLAVAGGIQLEQMELYKDADIIIIGSAICKAQDPKAAAHQFAQRRDEL